MLRRRSSSRTTQHNAADSEPALAPSTSELRLGRKDDADEARVSNTRASELDAASMFEQGLDPEDQALLDFDATDGLGAIVPMPATIHETLRRALIDVFLRRFCYYEDLDAWLQSPNASLSGVAPFELLVLGKGRSVLRAALKVPLLVDEITCTRPSTGPRLRLVR
jgi:hypothetical protein